MRSYLGQVDSMKRYSLLAIAVTTALVVVGLLYFSYGTSSRFTTLGIVNLPVMDDHGQQTVAVLQDASVLQEERKLHDSAGKSAIGCRQWCNCMACFQPDQAP